MLGLCRPTYLKYEKSTSTEVNNASGAVEVSTFSGSVSALVFDSRLDRRARYYFSLEL